MTGYLFFLLGIFAGMILTRIWFELRTSKSVFRIDNSNPKKDIYRFELDDTDCLYKKKWMLIRIDHHADLTDPIMERN